MNARSLDHALAEFEEAIEFHRKKSSILGVRFARAIDRAIVKILDHPTMWPFIWGPCRRCRLQKFKYGIVYRVGDGELVIVPFMHLSRDPDYWKGRE